MLGKITDEDQLWGLIQPSLRGKWWRLETVVPEGLSDAFGLWDSKTWWCELKIGKPSLRKLRPQQIDFGYDCMRHGIPHYVCFGWRGAPHFYSYFDFGIETTPPFYRPATRLLL